MEKLQSHFILCLLTGLVTILPVGGTILLIVYAERTLSPLIPAQFYIPGEGLVLVIALLYLLGLTLTSVVGRWLWHGLDSTLTRIPALGTIYRTLKQILGFDAGEGAFTARRRHITALITVRDALLASLAPLQEAEVLEVAAEHLRRARAALSDITGEHTTEDLLGDIFSQFCIGK